jgi:hypothetical protein
MEEEREGKLGMIQGPRKASRVGVRRGMEGGARATGGLSKEAQDDRKVHGGSGLVRKVESGLMVQTGHLLITYSLMSGMSFTPYFLVKFPAANPQYKRHLFLEALWIPSC